MAKCPFATQKLITGSSGDYTDTPFKIVHHTTEGRTAQAAMDAYAAKKADPHFTIDGTTIFQHIDTGKGARALKNPPGGVETNRARAIQMEIVAFAGKEKPVATLKNVARLCRWLEKEHTVPSVWPAGPPKPAKNGADPGGHNRDATLWTTKGGHYGHSHVPENVHWDPAYTAGEAAFLLAAKFNDDGKLTNSTDPAVAAILNRAAAPGIKSMAKPQKIDDHFDVGDDL